MTRAVAGWLEKVEAILECTNESDLKNYDQVLSVLKHVGWYVNCVVNPAISEWMGYVQDTITQIELSEGLSANHNAGTPFLTNSEPFFCLPRPLTGSFDSKTTTQQSYSSNEEGSDPSPSTDRLTFIPDDIFDPFRRQASLSFRWSPTQTMKVCLGSRKMPNCSPMCSVNVVAPGLQIAEVRMEAQTCSSPSVDPLFLERRKIRLKGRAIVSTLLFGDQARLRLTTSDRLKIPRVLF